MDVVSVSSLRVGSLIWRPGPSAWMLTVVCKATYALRPGEAALAPEQEEPNEHDGHWDDDPARSVLAPSDFAPLKTRSEVMLVGHAFAPGRQPARSLVARLTVGEVDKAVEVACDRSVAPDGAVQEGAWFARMPLRYERAAGGPGTWNPVGVRADARDVYGRRVLPNLAPAYRKGPEDAVEPAGFGPIAASWPARVERLGRSAAGFSTDALRERPLPEGFDYEFFNQAPPAPSARSPLDPPWSSARPAALPAPLPPPVPPPPASPAPAVDSPWVSRPAAEPVREAPPPTSAVVEAPLSTFGASGPQAALRPDLQGSALGASNAAAAAWAVPKPEVRPARRLPDPEPEPEPGARRALRLVWYDPESVPRVRRVARWKPLLDALDDRPLDRDLDDPAAEGDPMAAEDRREIFEILARASATDAEGVEQALRGAVRDDGKFVPPIVLVAGDLDFPFDELETLKAAVSAAAPLVTPADESLTASLDVAKGFLQTPGLSAPPPVSDGLTTRIREAFAKEKRSLPPDHLDNQMERVLLTERHYQKRALLGESHIRFLLRTPGAEHALVGYLPVKVAKQLPMFRRFRARLVAEVHLAEDQYETQPSALRVLALLRAGEIPARRS